jgi:hypothetical protein
MQCGVILRLSVIVNDIIQIDYIIQKTVCISVKNQYSPKNKNPALGNSFGSADTQVLVIGELGFSLFCSW